MSASITDVTEGRTGSGELAAFEGLLEPLFMPAYRLAFGMLRNREAAEDAVQEAALKAWRHRQSFRHGSPMRPWFFAIVANQCRSARRRAVSGISFRIWPAVVQTLAGDKVESEVDLRRALERLGHDDRLVVVLRYYLDLDYSEVAETLHITEHAARSRTQRAIRRLRLRLNPQEPSR